MVRFGLPWVLVAVAASTSDLSTDVTPTLVLWLAPTTIDATRQSGHVVRWRDESGGGYVFTPLTAAQHKAASTRWRTAVVKQRSRGGAGGDPAPSS